LEVTGGGLVVRETTCKYLRNLAQNQKVVKVRGWEITPTQLLINGISLLETVFRDRKMNISLSSTAIPHQAKRLKAAA
jgi:hypothetical protein